MSAIRRRARHLSLNVVKAFKAKYGRRPTSAELLEFADVYEAVAEQLRERVGRREERAVESEAAAPVVEELEASNG